MATANNPGLGTLGIFPREIRDEIYRYLVKDLYTLLQSPCDFDIRTLKRVLGSATQQSNFAIMAVSREIYHETSSMFYSESSFQFCAERYFDTVEDFNTYPLKSVLHRMTKIKFVFPGHYQNYMWYSHILDLFTCSGTQCTSLLIHFEIGQVFRDLHPKTGQRLLGELSQKLKALVSFRTITIHVIDDRRFCQLVDQEHERINQAIEQELVPLWGSATVTHVGSNVYFEFHPLESKIGNLDIRAKKLPSKMEKLKS